MYFTPLSLPPAALKLKRELGIVKVRCLIRNKLVVLTPEEWMRQHLLSYMMDHLLYPKGFIAVEFALIYNGGIKRCDILVVDRLGNPILIVECKAPEVEISQETFLQVAKYDHALNASYLLITNGLKHVFIEKSKSDNSLILNHEILSWKELIAV
jgi:hypothetical protein